MCYVVFEVSTKGRPGKKRHISLRVAEAAAVELDRAAERRGLSRNELAERYLNEGVAQDEFPQIAFRDGALGRRAILLGTRLDVWQVLETVRNHGNSVERAADYLDLSTERVRAAVRYAAAHKDEVEEITSREVAAAARAEELWRAEQELLAS
jgi:uncharacterized protein (DUF433 family)